MVLLVLLDALFYPRLIPVFQLEDYQTNRIRVYLGMPCLTLMPLRMRRDVLISKSGNHAQRGSSSYFGGLWGGARGGGDQNALGYLPLKKSLTTTSIFSVIAEEWGFLGSIAVVVLHGVILYVVFSSLPRRAMGWERCWPLVWSPLVHPCFHQHRSH